MSIFAKINQESKEKKSELESKFVKEKEEKHRKLMLATGYDDEFYDGRTGVEAKWKIIERLDELNINTDHMINHMWRD